MYSLDIFRSQKVVCFGSGTLGQVHLIRRVNGHLQFKGKETLVRKSPEGYFNIFLLLFFLKNSSRDQVQVNICKFYISLTKRAKSINLFCDKQRRVQMVIEETAISFFVNESSPCVVVTRK